MTRILYVEDNEDNIFIIQRRLGKIGHEVLVAKDGLEGIRIARAEQPALIMMDLDLPRLDGWEATRRLKSTPETANIPVIAVSAYAMPQDRRRALDAGCDNFFSKPVDMPALCSAIDTLVPPQP